METFSWSSLNSWAYMSFTIICLSSMIQTSEAQAKTDPDEVIALNSTFTKLGISETWIMITDPCSAIGQNRFIGCDCSYNNETLCHITGMDLSQKSLTGFLPSFIGNFTKLSKLNLLATGLSGAIPKELGNLQSLTYLNLGVNSLTGTIPKELGNLPNLTFLNLGGNSLSGTIPKELGNLRKLTSLLLEGNSLSGIIPKELGSLQNLDTLYLYSNLLSGAIPKELGNLKKLANLYLYNNLLSGAIPKELGNLQSLYNLDLNFNELSETIPKELGNLKYLNNLHLYSNSLSGEIPKELGNLQNLQKLYLYNNSLSGTIPKELGNLQTLTYLDLSINSFTGSLPSSFGNLTNMQTFDLSFNNIQGFIPQSLFILISLKYLFLGNNNLSGGLPSSKGSNLAVIDLSYNSFSGNLPNWASYNNTNLQLNLVANNFTEDDLKNSQKYTNLYCLQKGFPCNRNTPKYSSFAVNSGGPVVNSSGQGAKFSENIVFDEDDKELGAASFYVTNDRRWAVSSTGIYLNKRNSDYIIKSSSENCNRRNSSNDIRILLMDVRISAGSLRYYGLRLDNGIYSVKLQSVQLDSACESTRKSLPRHVFDIYIQGELQEKDFEIKNGGNLSNVSKEFKNIQVTKNILEILLFWAGKGTEDLYGPSIAAVSAILESTESKKLAESTPNRRNLGTIISISLSCGLVILLVILIAFILRRKMSLRTDHELREITFRTCTFSYAELKKATKDFDPRNKLGEGGFGPVYKGVLSDGRVVAVKQLSLKSHQGKIQFVTEIDMISSLQHRNLVKLYGCCIEGLNRLLVYEYMKNKSLDQALFGKNDLHLSWNTRFEICVGTGRGLAYLHEESMLKIVHRDVKASNILLDAELKPKLSDFGLAKLYDDSITHISTRIAGTFGYLAPEYVLKGHLTEKADVFGFGVVLFEILSGRPNYTSNLSSEQVYLLEWAWLLHENSRQLELIDPRLNDFNKEEAIRVFTVGLLCTQLLPTHRPSMSRIVSMLLGDAELTDISSKPDYLNDLNMVDLEGSLNILPSTISTTLSSRW